MKPKSKREYEDYLNEFYSSTYSMSEAVDLFIYLTNEYRANGSVAQIKLMSAYISRRLGTILRKYDSIAFEVGYNEWK